MNVTSPTSNASKSELSLTPAASVTVDGVTIDAETLDRLQTVSSSHGARLFVFLTLYLTSAVPTVGPHLAFPELFTRPLDAQQRKARIREIYRELGMPDETLGPLDVVAEVGLDHCGWGYSTTSSRNMVTFNPTRFTSRRRTRRPVVRRRRLANDSRCDWQFDTSGARIGRLRFRWALSRSVEAVAQLSELSCPPSLSSPS